MEKKITFNKKIQKAKTMAHFVSIEKAFIEMLGLAPGDTVKVTIERIDDTNVLKQLAQEKMEKENVESIAISKDGIFGELKNEDNDNDIDDDAKPKD